MKQSDHQWFLQRGLYDPVRRTTRIMIAYSIISNGGDPLFEANLTRLLSNGLSNHVLNLRLKQVGRESTTHNV